MLDRYACWMGTEVTLHYVDDFTVDYEGTLTGLKVELSNNPGELLYFVSINDEWMPLGFLAQKASAVPSRSGWFD